MISDLLRFEIQTKLTEPMFAGMSAWMGGFFAPSYPAPVPGVFDAKGDAWLNGKIVPYARGDVVYGPTVFPMAQGWGLMGEAGPEGVLPLARTSSGDLGVKSAGGGQPVNIVNNFYVSAVDGESVARFFQRYSRQVSNALETELRAGNRSLRGMIRRTT
jgi:phage-related minor tail protein